MRVHVLLMCVVVATAFACKREQESKLRDDQAPAAAKDPDPASYPPATNTANFWYHGANIKGDTRVVLNDPKPALDALGKTDKTSMVATNTTANGTTGSSTFDPSAGSATGGTSDGAALSLADNDSDYMKTCALPENDTPMPPAWGSPLWKKEGDLKTDKVLILTEFLTTLWTYTNEKGTCAALPRTDKSSGVVSFMGIICNSKTTGKTCFYDNVDPASGAPTDKLVVNDGYHVRNVAGADRLQEVCANCHRGDNPWVVVPGEVTENIPNPDAGKRHDPVGPAAWQNPAGTLALPGCNGDCHSIPELTGEYCMIGRELITKKLMPDGGGTKGQKPFIEACAKNGW